MEFLEARRRYLAEHGVTKCESLVPHIDRHGNVGYWTDGMWGKVKDDAQGLTGIKLNIQELRAILAQMCKDKGAPIEFVSRAMRHRTTKTTEPYYARIRAEDAFRDFEQAFLR